MAGLQCAGRESLRLLDRALVWVSRWRGLSHSKVVCVLLNQLSSSAVSMGSTALADWRMNRLSYLSEMPRSRYVRIAFGRDWKGMRTCKDRHAWGQKRLNLRKALPRNRVLGKSDDVGRNN